MSKHDRDHRIEQGLRQVMARHVASVAEVGWSVQAVFGDPESGTPALAYTIGLSGKGLPDVLVLGLPVQHASEILDGVARQLVADASKASHGTLIHEVANLPLKVVAADQLHAQHFAKISQDFAEAQGGDATLVQILIPDINGIFPGEPGCDPQIEAMQDLRLHLPAVEDEAPRQTRREDDQ